MKRELIIVLISFALIVSGCSGVSDNANIDTQSACIAICMESLESGMDLSDGPCLSDSNPDWIIDDWVCDVAHDPRQDVDNLPENQCQEYRGGLAHHFIEVDPDCKFIRAI